MSSPAHPSLPLPPGRPRARGGARSGLARLPALVLAGMMFATTARAQDERQFDIALPDAPLSDALKQIAQQTGEDILFTTESVAGIRSRPVLGRMSARTAIEMVIAGTRLEVLPGGSRSLVVRKVVTAAAPVEKAGAPEVAEPVAEPVGHVTITGTSIRDSGLVGARLDVIDRGLIENTASITPAQMLKLAPAVTVFGGSGVGQLPGTSYYAPTIHSLGASASNSTLVLIDGHRLPVGGNQHVLPDPNMVPAIAVERIEILADGSSSVYGSDAVGGVINIITRK